MPPNGQCAKPIMLSAAGKNDGGVSLFTRTFAQTRQVCYMAQHPLLDQVPSLRDSVREPHLCGPTGVEMVNAWVGTRGTKTPLHFDSYDNFLCQVAGFKYLRLYSQVGGRQRPAGKGGQLREYFQGGLFSLLSTYSTAQAWETHHPWFACPLLSLGGWQAETPKLYMGRSSAGEELYTQAQHNISPVDVAAPDLSKYPAFADAEYSEAVLAPGEMLFIPAKYWHFVRSLTTAISVNFWF